MLNSRESDHLLSSKFRVEINGVTQGAFAKVSGMESITEVIEYANGDDMRIRKRPERTTYSNILLTQGALLSHDLWE